MNYVDYVVCQHHHDDRLFLFYAPAWSRLKAGDEVIVDTVRGQFPAVVVEVSTIQKDDEPLKNMIKRLAGATEPLRRVISKVRFDELTYETEDEDDSV